MSYLNYIFLGIAIISLLYTTWRNIKIKKTLKKIDDMLDLATTCKLSQERFDESMLSKVESKFNRYLLGLASSEINLHQQKKNIEVLVSDISHQIKTPIANISLYSELLIENPSEEYINQIIFQTEKLKFLIQSLVKTSRLENGIIKLIPSNNNINVIIESIIKSTEYKAKDKDKNIKIVYREEGEHMAFFDPKWTEEAIYNIVDNSIKYSRDNGEIRIIVTEYPLFIRIDIIDNGIGISEDEMTKIFKRFYRSERVSAIEGVGIGLYLAREIIQGENGYIKVESQVGKGSTFSIFLPKDYK